MQAPLAINALETTTVYAAFALVPLGLLAVWCPAARRTGRGVPARDAWRDSAAEAGAVAGTLPWLLLVLTPRGAAGAAIVEAAQYGFGTGRVASVDDVLLNALGALLGALGSRRWWRSSRARAVAERAPAQAVLGSAGRDWRVTFLRVSRGTDRAARC